MLHDGFTSTFQKGAVQMKSSVKLSAMFAFLVSTEHGLWVLPTENCVLKDLKLLDMNLYLILNFQVLDLWS